MNSVEFDFKESFLQEVKVAAAESGEGSCAAFVDKMSAALIDSEVLSDFVPSYYVGQAGRSRYRVDGYIYDEFDNAMNLAIANFDGNDEERRMTNAIAEHNFGQLRLFLNTALRTNLYQEIEPSTSCADLVDFLRRKEKDIRKYRFLIFTDADLSASVKSVELDDYEGIPIEGQIWDINRVFRVCCSDQGRQTVEIDFRQYCGEGIPCLEASSAASSQYKSYLGVIPGEVLAEIYDKYGSRLLEGNVRSFLSTKVAVNKKIRETILKRPEMFLAFNNGISATAMDVEITVTDHGCFITFVRDFQIINGGQTTASVSNARYRDKADLSRLYVQMKLTAIDESSQEESDELIRDISRSSNSQNKVSDADFFASHPFHRQMEQISRRLFAPAVNGAQYETKWFYERARGQYLQEQMRLTSAKKKQFELQNPKNQVIKKTDLAKVQNVWRGFPHIVSKGAQTNFSAFADYIDEQWRKDETQFNELYFKSTAALILMFQFLEKQIPKQSWYQDGYRANVVYYTLAQFHRLIKQQFFGSDLDLLAIWNRQNLPQQIQSSLLQLAELVFSKITDPKRKIINVTQWCKRPECWETVQTIKMPLSAELAVYLITRSDHQEAQRAAKKDQQLTNNVNAQIEAAKYTSDQWKRLAEFIVKNHLTISADKDGPALQAICKAQNTGRYPPDFQCRRLLALLKRAEAEGFSMEG
ncbi:MAG: AIPR family protein [Oscillospiraceae bacterium]|jgi:hypothetical protein|nr:AIPR family protein [Oscillospiraceae bacterium]